MLVKLELSKEQASLKLKQYDYKIENQLWPVYIDIDFSGDSISPKAYDAYYANSGIQSVETVVSKLKEKTNQLNEVYCLEG